MNEFLASFLYSSVMVLITYFLITGVLNQFRIRKEKKVEAET